MEETRAGGTGESVEANARSIHVTGETLEALVAGDVSTAGEGKLMGAGEGVAGAQGVQTVAGAVEAQVAGVGEGEMAGGGEALGVDGGELVRRGSMFASAMLPPTTASIACRHLRYLHDAGILFELRRLAPAVDRIGHWGLPTFNPHGR